jgi:hypothetical protein
MTPDELSADMEGLIENVALPWIEAKETFADPEDLTKAGQAVRDLLKAYQEQRRALEEASPVVPVGVSEAVLKAAQSIHNAAIIYEDEALLEDAQIVLAALRPTYTGWRDIATAPRDGRVVLVFSAARCVWSVVSAQWRQDWPNGGWDTISKHTTPIVPTHWMPLPPAPIDTGREA